MNVTIRVLRQDPEAEDTTPFWQEYSLDVEDNATVLDVLIKVREDLDGTLSLRCSCRSSICGSCAMRINGHAGLACKTQAAAAVNDGDIIEVEPAGNMPVIKDLVVNFDLFWDKIMMEVDPYLQPEGPEPEQEYVVSNESMRHLSSVTSLHHVRCLRVGLHCYGGGSVLPGSGRVGKGLPVHRGPTGRRQRGRLQGSSGSAQRPIGDVGLHPLP